MIVSALRIVFVLFYSALVSSIILIVVPLTRNERLFHSLARLHAKGVLYVCGIRVTVEGTDRVDFTRQHIYVANHASYFDIPIVIAGVPDQIRIVYKKELEKIPIFGWGLKFGGTYIGIDRKKGQDAWQSLDRAADKIRNGASVLLFAEGTRTSDGRLQPFKRGPFYLAMRAGVPVVPLAIKGSFDVLNRNSLRIRPGEIRLVLHDEILPPPPNGKEREIELREAVHTVLEKALQQAA